MVWELLCSSKVCDLKLDGRTVIMKDHKKWLNCEKKGLRFVLVKVLKS